jgi:hypothetical protein
MVFAKFAAIFAKISTRIVVPIFAETLGHCFMSGFFAPQYY